MINFYRFPGNACPTRHTGLPTQTFSKQTKLTRMSSALGSSHQSSVAFRVARPSASEGGEGELWYAGDADPDPFDMLVAPTIPWNTQEKTSIMILF